MEDEFNSEAMLDLNDFRVFKEGCRAVKAQRSFNRPSTGKVPAGSIDSSPPTPKPLRQKIGETSKALPLCGGAG